MNTLVKRIAALVSVVGIMPLCAMEIVTKSNTRGKSDKFWYDAARQGLPSKKLKTEDSTKVNVEGHDGFDQLDARKLESVLGEVGAEKFRKLIGIKKQT